MVALTALVTGAGRSRLLNQCAGATVLPNGDDSSAAPAVLPTVVRLDGATPAHTLLLPSQLCAALQAMHRDAATALRQHDRELAPVFAHSGSTGLQISGASAIHATLTAIDHMALHAVRPPTSASTGDVSDVTGTHLPAVSLDALFTRDNLAQVTAPTPEWLSGSTRPLHLVALPSPNALLPPSLLARVASAADVRLVIRDDASNADVKMGAGVVPLASRELDDAATTTLQVLAGCVTLHAACESGNELMVEVMLTLNDAGQVDAQQEDGRTALHVAARKGHERVVELLLASGSAAVNACGKDGFTPLHLAALGGHAATAARLLAGGAEVDARCATGHTALLFACYTADDELVELLLGKGAEVNARDADQCTPLHLACYSGSQAVAERLLDAGAEVEARDKEGSVPLHFAAEQGHQGAVEALLSKGGASANVQRADGCTPLQLAKPHDGVAKLLRARGAAAN